MKPNIIENKVERKSSFHVYKSIPIAIIIVTLAACGQKRHPRRTQGNPPADRTTQTQTPENKKETTAERKPNGQQQPAPTKQADASRPPAPPVIAKPAPSTTSPSQPTAKPEVPRKQTDALETMFNLPEVTPLDTFGGQLLTSYLSGEISGEQVIAQVFDNKDLAMSNLAEMSAAIWNLRENRRYNDQDQAKVLILEGAMTRFLNDQLRTGQRYTAALEYGTAIALGAAGGFYSNEILNGLRRFGNSSIVQLPISGVKYAYNSLGSGAQSVTNWFRARWARSGSEATASSDEAVSRASEMYRRTVGYFNTPSTAADRQLTVFQNIYRVLNSPNLAKGYRVDPVAANLTDFAKRQEYFRTGIPGFQISQPQGKDYLLAQLVSRGGELEYYRVTGVAIKAVTKDGSEKIVPPEVLTGSIATRLRAWGERTASGISSATKTVATGIGNSRPVRYVTSDPMGRRIAQGVAVGAPISALTLLALKPIDTSYVTLDGYVRELESEGLQVNLDQFAGNQRQKALSGR